MAVPVLLVSMALGAATAQAEDGLKTYRVTVDGQKAGTPARDEASRSVRETAAGAYSASGPPSSWTCVTCP